MPNEQVYEYYLGLGIIASKLGSSIRRKRVPKQLSFIKARLKRLTSNSVPCCNIMVQSRKATARQSGANSAHTVRCIAKKSTLHYKTKQNKTKLKYCTQTSYCLCNCLIQIQYVNKIRVCYLHPTLFINSYNVVNYGSNSRIWCHIPWWSHPSEYMHCFLVHFNIVHSI